MLIKVVFVTSVLVIGEGLAANIAKLKECDGQICTKDQYCSTFNDKCEPCSDICDPGTHNYHEKDCFTYCPDHHKDNKSLEQQLASIENRQIAIIVLLCLVIAFLIFRHAPQCIKWLKSKHQFTSLLNKMKRTSTKKSQANANPTIQIPKPNIFTVPEPSSAETATTRATTATRFPTESSLDFSYDNKALQMTPSP